MKDKFLKRRVLAVIMAVVLLVTGIGINSFAASSAKVGDKGRVSYTQYLKGTSALSSKFGNHSIQKLTIKKKGDGKKIDAFCVEPGVAFPTSSDYSYTAKSSTAGKGTKYYKAAMYYYKENNNDINRIAVQLWCWQIYKANVKAGGNKDLTKDNILNATTGFKALFINVLTGNVDGTKNYDAVSQNKAENIYTESKKIIVDNGSTGDYNKKVELIRWTADNSQTLISGDVSEERQVKLRVEKEGQNIGNNAFVAGCTYKVYFDAACKNAIKAYNSTKDALMTVKSNGISNTVTLDATKQAGDWIVYVREYKTNEGTVINSKPYPVVFKRSDVGNVVTTVHTTNEEKRAKFKIHKVDDSGKVLSGIEFTTYQQKNGKWEKIESKLTDDNGNVQFGYEEGNKKYMYTKSNNGRFKITETKTRKGYVLPNWTREVNLSKYDGEEKEFSYSVTNIPDTSTLKIKKADDSGNIIEADAEFVLYKISEDDLIEWNNGKYGSAYWTTVAKRGTQIPLKRGDDGVYYAGEVSTDSTYILVEQSPPEGYLLGSSIPPYMITSKNDGSRINKNAYNNINDGSSGWDDNGRMVQQYIVPFYIGTDTNNVITIEVYDDPATTDVRIQKKDAETGSKAQGDATLEDAVFGLFKIHQEWDKNGKLITNERTDELVATAITDENGNGYFGEVPAGVNYYVKELSHPIGYMPADEHTFENDEVITYDSNGIIRDCVIYIKNLSALNEVIEGSVKVFKYTSNHEGKQIPLSGVKFGVYLASSLNDWSEEVMESYDYTKYTPVTTFKTGSDGYGESEKVPYGKYVVVEMEALHNYLIAAPQVVDIDENFQFSSEPAYLEFENDKFSSELEIVKIDAETGDIVTKPGNTFKVLNLDTNTYVKQSILKITEGSFEEGEYTSELVETTTFTTDETGKVTLPNVLEAGNYQIEEIISAEGYKLNKEPVKFVIDSDMEYDINPETNNPIISIKFENNQQTGQIIIKKRGPVVEGYDEDFTYVNQNINGATFGIYAAEDIYKVSDGKTVVYKKDDLVTKITAEKDGEAIADKLIPAKYYIKELSAPKGFVISNEIKNVELSVDKEVLEEEVTFTNDKQRLKILVTKIDKETKKTLVGAKFGVFIKEDILSGNAVILAKDTLIEESISDAQGVAEFTKDYPVGAKLYIKELVPPEGYITSDEIIDVVFSAENQDVSTVTKTYTFGNDPKEISVTKYDITTSKECPGNELKVVYKENGKEVVFDSWVSTNEPHIIKYLTVNKSYKLIETKPADGYTTATAVEFTVKDNGEVDAIEMYNDVTKLQISKTDITTGKPVIGATLQILDMNGALLKEFITTDNPEDMYFEKLPMGDYILREKLAPEADGYVKAADVTFTIQDTGEIQKVEMKDDYTKLVIRKIDASTGDFVKKAILTLSDSQGNIVDTWETDGKEHVINYIAPGQYTLSETVQGTPWGYVVAEDMTINVSATGEEQIYVMQDEHAKGQIILTKKDKNSGELLKGAVFSVIDKETEEEIIRIVSGEDGVAATQLLDIAKYSNGECVGMKAFKIKEIKAPKGYQLDDTEYVVQFDYVDANNNVIVFDLGNVYNIEKTSFIPITGDYFNTIVPIILAISVIVLTGLSIIYSKKKRA